MMRRSIEDFQYRPELELGLRAVREAGEYVKSLSEGQKSVHARPPHDVKLSGDIASESIIVNVIREESALPILAEESGLHGVVDTAGPYWIVDPIDGSFNFYRGIPLVAISVALWRREEPIFGVVYEFERQDLYVGVVGVGAWLNNTPSFVSKIQAREDAVLATGLPVQSLGDDRYIGRLGDMFRSFGKIRMFGTAALSLAYLSCGRVDAYAEDEIMLWDVAAGLALVKAAGGYTHFERADSDNALRVRCASVSGVWV